MASGDGPEASKLFVGAPVIVRGLQGAPEYNGCKGSVTAGPAANGRFEATLQIEGQDEAKVLALKPGNLQLDLEACMRADVWRTVLHCHTAM